MGKKRGGFYKGSPIRLKNGAVIVPVSRWFKSIREGDELILFLQNSRWIRCEHQSDCIEATQNWEGFSCESCPFVGKSEHAFHFDQARATYDALRCYELLTAAYGS